MHVNVVADVHLCVPLLHGRSNSHRNVVLCELNTVPERGQAAMTVAEFGRLFVRKLTIFLEIHEH
jgi:hypothetical protein